MKSILDVFKIIKKDIWMASVDLEDAFFKIPLNETYQKYFMFARLCKIYKFIAMPNAYLRQQGYLSVIFVDDLYLQGGTKQECIQNVEATVSFWRA